jgi:hypothetical protein
MPTVSRRQLEAMPGFDPAFHLGEQPDAVEPVLPTKADEKAFQAAVIKEAKRQGWLVYHTHNSRKSQPGFPDLVLLRGERAMFRELKVPPNKMTPEQDEWLYAMREAGLDASIWVPDMWPMIEKELAR